jgi:hypothetical protein
VNVSFRKEKDDEETICLADSFGVASFANAAIVVVAVDSEAASIQTDPIDEEHAATAFFVGVQAGLELGAGQMLYGGSLAAIEDYTGVDPDLTEGVRQMIGADPSKIEFVQLFHADPDNPVPVMGELVSYAVLGGEGEVHLLDGDTLESFSSVYIPEPITIALLGLGGLFLRRRR